jgi:GNAT superfamily N-acetyltransferase
MSTLLQSRTFLLATGELTEFIQVSGSTWEAFRSEILQIERLSFADSIRATEDELHEVAKSASAVFFVARLVNSQQIVAYLAADRLELFAEVPGVVEDSHFRKRDTLYITSVAVHPNWRRRGLGVALQRDCVNQARRLGYARVSAHLRSGASHKLGLVHATLSTFDNWYKTGDRFSYVAFPTSQNEVYPWTRDGRMEAKEC